MVKLSKGEVEKFMETHHQVVILQGNTKDYWYKRTKNILTQALDTVNRSIHWVHLVEVESKKYSVIFYVNQRLAEHLTDFVSEERLKSMVEETYGKL